VAQKLMIVLLVVVAVVFVVTLALGGSHAPRAPDDSDPDGISFLGGLQGNRFLRLGDEATTTCSTGDQVTLNVPIGGCTITVGKRSLFSKPIRIAFVTAGPITVTVDSKSVPGRGQQVPDDKGHTCFMSSVDHDGGTITLAASTSTAITLLTTKCGDAGS
jgi:hypothetical protein